MDKFVLKLKRVDDITDDKIVVMEMNLPDNRNSNRGPHMCESCLFVSMDYKSQMMSMDYKSHICSVFRFLPPGIQVILISASMPPEIVELRNKFQKNPIRILVKRDDIRIDKLKQYYIPVGREKFKYNVLCDLYDNLVTTQAVVFCNAKETVDTVSEKMKNANYTVSSMHNATPLKVQASVKKQFKDGDCRFVLATDVWSQEFVVFPKTPVIVNYDLPNTLELYPQRVGRKGVAINFVTSDDHQALQEIEQYYSTKIEELPNGDDWITVTAAQEH